MKKNIIVGFVCILTVTVTFTVRAQEKAQEHKEGKGHAHPTEAPHGGTVVPLGKHSYNLEFVRDPDAGKLLVYVLDGHMEYVGVKETSFTVIAKAQGKEHKLTMTRTGDAAKASVFEGSADWIKGTKKFDGSIPQITLNGKSFSKIFFTFPKAAKHAH